MNYLELENRVIEILETGPKHSSSRAEALEILRAAVRAATEKIIDRTWLLSNANTIVERGVEAASVEWAQKRASGIPLEHLTGVKYFFSREYFVTPEVLIPRPETEILVESAIQAFERNGFVFGQGLEIGLGSGIISIELLSRFSGLRMFATDFSQSAISIARINAEAHGIEKDRLTVHSVGHSASVLEEVPNLEFDFLISNPPYLSFEDEIDAEALRHEPHGALFANSRDPLHFYVEIAAHANRVLKPGALIFLEVPHGRAEMISELFQRCGHAVRLKPDLTGRHRILECVSKGIENGSHPNSWSKNTRGLGADRWGEKRSITDSHFIPTHP